MLSKLYKLIDKLKTNYLVIPIKQLFIAGFLFPQGITSEIQRRRKESTGSR